VEREIFDLPGAAEYLGHSRRWLRENCISLGIGHERVGRKYRFTLHELERFLTRHRRKGKKGVYVP
jgi:excisionase family DNA binding protein